LSYAPEWCRRTGTVTAKNPNDKSSYRLAGGLSFGFWHFLVRRRNRNYSMIFETTPEPTVRPPSRIAKRTPSSMAIALCSSTEIFTLSPGMHISASVKLAVPVTSVVRK